MKETVTTLTCDDCRKKVTKFFYSSPDNIDLCSSCGMKRIQHSLKLVPSLLCQFCAGEGRIEGRDHHYGDPVLERCPSCDGAGTISLK